MGLVINLVERCPTNKRALLKNVKVNLALPSAATATADVTKTAPLVFNELTSFDALVKART